MSVPVSDMLSRDYFELFGLAPAFMLDVDSLDARYRDLQKSAHPDRFAGATDRERRLAVQRTAHINEAYQTLKDPLKRARYLLEARGVTVGFEDNTAMDPEFLMTQMEMREALEEAAVADDPVRSIESVKEQIAGHMTALQDELRHCFTSGAQEDLVQAGAVLRKLQFLKRLQQHALEREDEFLQV